MVLTRLGIVLHLSLQEIAPIFFLILLWKHPTSLELSKLISHTKVQMTITRRGSGSLNIGEGNINGQPTNAFAGWLGGPNVIFLVILCTNFDNKACKMIVIHYGKNQAYFG